MASAVGADDQVWSVRRRWVPHRHGIGWRARFRGRLLRRRSKGLADGLDGLGAVDDLLVGIAILVAAVLLVLFGWPLLMLALDLVWLVAAVAIGIVARVVFRRPWQVEAIDAAGSRSTWEVVGFRAAGRKRDEVVELIEAGLDPALVTTDRRVATE